MKDEMKADYLNIDLPDKKRVDDLVSRMTLEEKVSQLRYNAPSIKRLGIPFYNWWNEALHGVARAGAATVFPQSIGLAAMFDDEFMQEIADIISTEGRAKYNEQVRLNDRGLYKGITYWSPNINIFRDPRWGRGHETYGEDPYLTTRMGIGFIKGIQGDGKRLKAAACVKHFVAHSGPEQERHSFDSIVSKKDLAETYFPAFKACVKEGKVEGVMGAYNRVNGEPACGSKRLIEGVLRKEWGFDGYFVSDCGAIQDFHDFHGVTSTAEESAALALKAGCDLNCGNIYLHVLKAYQKGLVEVEDIDRAVKRLMMTRMRLGMFDESTEYDHIPYEANDTKEHHQVALKAACKSMVLLKNDGILPINKDDLKTVAIIGPNANSREILKGNYNGTATRQYTILDGIRSLLNSDTRVFYSEACHLYQDQVESLAESDDRISEAISMAKRSDVVFLCLGLNATLEGEEGDANNNYAGADKKDLNLPSSQIRLMEAICKLNKKVVLLLSTGSAMELSYASEHCNAIMQTWYPGQMGGLAAGKLLFGEESPSGRLPITFYKTTKELPDFSDYSMKNRTYRYMENRALYPFGFGLSYAKFSYSNLSVDSSDIKNKETISLRVDVTNTSLLKGDEIVQVYVKILGTNLAVRNYSLVQFKRIHLNARETKVVKLPIPNSVFQVINDEGKRQCSGTKAVLYVGGNQPDKRSIELTGNTPKKLEFSL